MATFKHIRFGDGLTVIDEGAGVITVNGAGGPAGPAGPQGPAGVPGASTFVSGSGPPTAGVGVDGSVYLDVQTGVFYGPKASGAWPAAEIGHLVRTKSYGYLMLRYADYGAVLAANTTYAQLLA